MYAVGGAQIFLSLQVERRTEVAVRDAKLQKMSRELASVLAAHDEVMAQCASAVYISGAVLFSPRSSCTLDHFQT